jgi:hypothetical protein
MLMFAVSPKPYEGFRGCMLMAANNSPRVAYISLAVVEAGKYVEQTKMFHVGSYNCEVVLTLMMISAYRSRLCMRL